MFHMLPLWRVVRVVPLAHDVGEFSAGRLPAATRSGLDRQMVESRTGCGTGRHAEVLAWRSSRVWRLL